jgi:CYTH domain-containing protein
MGLEIERKYRVLTMDHPELPEGIPIDQAYLATGDSTVRVRLKGERAFLTIKVAHDGIAPDGASDAVVCQEFEYEIPASDAKQLLQATEDRMQKTRYHFANGVELDIFHGRHNGLVMAEFESQDGSQAPPIPGVEWVEVSGDRRYSNAWMARYGVPPLDD